LENVPVAAGIGETLREARQDAGVGLEAVERTIRIRARYLAALENEDWDVLPGEAYLRGFLHTYGDYLGLDGAGLVDQYDRLGLGAEREHPVEAPLEPPHRAAVDPFWRRVVAIAVGLVGALVVLFVVLGITGGSEKGGGHRHHHGGKQAGEKTRSTTTTTTSAPTEASLTLQPTGTVWVCLVDHAGAPLVNGETLSIGDDRGPFKDREMKLTLGNGEIRLILNGKDVPIPSAAEPVGFDLTPQGAKPLSSTARPTCS
jgi:cytoskeleton protein RodZ